MICQVCDLDKKQTKNASSSTFVFGGGWGMSLLIFAKQGRKIVSICFAKIFGHRSKTTHCVVFSLRSNPPILLFTKQKKHPLARMLSCFGGGWGIRTLVPVKANGFQVDGMVSHPVTVCPQKSLKTPDFYPFSCNFLQFLCKMQEKCKKKIKTVRVVISLILTKI